MALDQRSGLDERMAEVVGGLPRGTSKSEKMRRLGRAGFRAADIARFLGVRYQFAYNVLNAANLGVSGVGRAATTDRPTEVKENGTIPADERWAWTKVRDDGTVTLPKQMRVALGLSAGAPVQIELSGDTLVIRPRSTALREAREMLGPYRPEGYSAVDELIADRRAEAGRTSGG